jgi:RNA polymerase sigma-70 factor (ECF subfamily)
VTDRDRAGHLGGVRADPTDDASSLRAIYDRYHDPVWRTLACLGVPDHAIEDAVQEVFIVVHRRLEDSAQYGSLKAWIYAIARRVAWHTHRGAARAQRKLAAVEVARTDDITPEVHAQCLQARAILLRILDAMPHEQRIVFVLAEIEGLSAPEIAQSVEVALNTVYSRLRLARARFEREAAQIAGRHEHGT